MGIEYIYEPFSYGVMVRSLIVAISVGLMLPLLGAYVINRNLGFMGDAIAHASLPALVLGLLIGVSVLIAAIPAAIFIALLIGYLISRSKIGEDTAIGIIFSSFFALGFILLSIFKQITYTVEDLLLGQILGVSISDVLITLILSVIVLITSLMLFKQFLFVSFDPIGAKVSGLRVKLLDNIFIGSIKENRPIDTVIHLAGLKSVSESLTNPLHYWDVNVLGTLNLLLTMKEYKCYRNLRIGPRAEIF